MSLKSLLQGDTESAVGAQCPVTSAQYAGSIVGSGFPGLHGLSERAARSALNGYLENVVQREFPEQGLAVRRPQTLRDWLRAYAAATATTASYTTILAAATPGQDNKPARSTVTGYRDVLDQLWLLDELPAWLPTDNVFARLATTPKHFLADPGLAAALLNRTADDLLTRAEGSLAATPCSERSLNTCVALSVSVYADAISARVSHFRERESGREVDLIVEQGDANCGDRDQVSARDRFTGLTHSIGSANGSETGSTASVVINTGSVCYRRDDGILVLPAALLGP